MGKAIADRQAQRPIDAYHLAAYVGSPIWIDYGSVLERRWLKGFEDIRGDTVAVVENGLGPWMGEYGWGWQAWAKKPTEEEREAHPLGARIRRKIHESTSDYYDCHLGFERLEKP